MSCFPISTMMEVIGGDCWSTVLLLWRPIPGYLQYFLISDFSHLTSSRPDPHVSHASQSRSLNHNEHLGSYSTFSLFVKWSPYGNGSFLTTSASFPQYSLQAHRICVIITEPFLHVRHLAQTEVCCAQEGPANLDLGLCEIHRVVI